MKLEKKNRSSVVEIPKEREEEKKRFRWRNRYGRVEKAFEEECREDIMDTNDDEEEDLNRYKYRQIKKE